MKKLFFTLLVLIQFFSNHYSLAQNHPSYEVPKVVQPSGTAAAFARYGEIPVDLSTGVPGIEVPIYTITSRRLSVPLSLSYHGGGIKVDDISSPVGLGWC